MNHDRDQHSDSDRNEQPTPWMRVFGGMWRTPLGLLGIVLTTVSATLMVFVLIIDFIGMVNRPYSSMVAYLILPGAMVFGLLLIPLAAYLRHRRWRRYGTVTAHLTINLSNPRHQKFLLGFIALTVINFAILAVAGYEGYHFTESPFFCGVVCHQVMDPEYTAYQRSPHAKVTCVECHIGPGADWFVKSKLSGLRQVAAMVTGDYSRPIPAPVEHLRPARDTCENCHWPEKFHGKRIKEFISFSNRDQLDPDRTEIALHIGGRNPETDAFEGIHWHVSNALEVSYLAADEKRLEIAKIRVKRPDGTEEEFIRDDIDIPEERRDAWRVMDCIDCHNRPTHVFDIPEERVDFGLLSKKINGEIPGIREDSLAVLTAVYPSRDEAVRTLVASLVELQSKRDQEAAETYKDDLDNAGAFLLEVYLNNIWPAMNVDWGTYRSHLGHQYADEGYGCFRCHDEEHISSQGEVVSQDCSLCHDEP